MKKIKLLACPVCGNPSFTHIELLSFSKRYKFVFGFQHICGAFIRLNTFRWTLHGMLSCLLTMFLSVCVAFVFQKIPVLFYVLFPLVALFSFNTMTNVFDKLNFRVVEKV